MERIFKLSQPEDMEVPDSSELLGIFANSEEMIINNSKSDDIMFTQALNCRSFKGNYKSNSETLKGLP